MTIKNLMSLIRNASKPLFFGIAKMFIFHIIIGTRKKWRQATNVVISRLMKLPMHRAEARPVGLILLPPDLLICSMFEQYFLTVDLMRGFERLLRRYPQMLVLSDVKIKRHSIDSVVFFTREELQNNGCDALVRRCIRRAYLTRLSRNEIIIDRCSSCRTSRSYEKFCKRIFAVDHRSQSNRIEE